MFPPHKQSEPPLDCYPMQLYGDSLYLFFSNMYIECNLLYNLMITFILFHLCLGNVKLYLNI